MASKEEAAALKDQGNKAFAGKEWLKAIEFYSKAIELDDTVPAYFSNRAQVCTLRGAPADTKKGR